MHHKIIILTSLPAIVKQIWKGVIIDKSTLLLVRITVLSQENRYDLSAGCLPCPPCYGLVQKEVHKLQKKLSEVFGNSGGLDLDDGGDTSQLYEQIKKLNKTVQEAYSAVLQNSLGRLLNAITNVNITPLTACRGWKGRTQRLYFRLLFIQSVLLLRMPISWRLRLKVSWSAHQTLPGSWRNTKCIRLVQEIPFVPLHLDFLKLKFFSSYYLLPLLNYSFGSMGLIFYKTTLQVLSLYQVSYPLISFQLSFSSVFVNLWGTS